jgi:hypothetical protein
VLALVLVLGPPLLLRGPVVRWIVERETTGLCGTIRIDDGHPGWLFVLDLARRRPFSVELRGLRVVGPDGTEVLAAAEISAAVAVERAPFRIEISPVIVSRGRWRLAVDATGNGNGGFLGVFRPVPDNGRAACLERAPRARPGPNMPPVAPRVAPSVPGFALEHVRLDDVDVELDFPMWGLSLPRVRATGAVGFGTPAGSAFTFDVRNANAPGGTLRVGPGGPAKTVATTTARFDVVVITHVGISPANPGDLTLEVGRADTGRSRLSGTATFENVVAHHGRHGRRNPPGLSLDARWERLSDAVARVDAGWLPREALGEILDGGVAARMRGPFQALSGTLSIEGSRAGIEVAFEDGARATVDLRATNLALAPFLQESLTPLLAGRMTGKLQARLAFPGGLGDADIQIPSADVALTRESRRAVPRRLTFHVGRPDARTPTWDEADDTLALGLTSARLYRRTLRLEGLFARWAELSARGTLALALPAAEDGGPAPPARLDASMTMTLGSLARWVPPETATASGAARVQVSGPLDHLRARLAFSRATSATVLGDRFRVPDPITARLDDGHALALDAFGLARVGGGRLDARGRADLAGPIAGELRLSRYPLASLPGLDTVTLPAALGGGRVMTLHQSLGGTLDATLRVAGETARPAFTGTLGLAGVELAGRRIGDGALRARAHGWTMTLDGTLGPSLALTLGATRGRDGVTADAKLDVRDLALAPWLPPALSGLDVAVTGAARVAVAPRRPFSTQADLRAVGAGGDLQIHGATSGDTAEASAKGHVELGGLRSLWGQALAAADGTIAVDVATAPRAPLRGTLVVSRALSLRPKGWPLALGVAEGGRLDVDATHVRIPGLTLTTDGARVTVTGDVQGDLAAPERSTIDLHATAAVDARAVARQAKLPALASAAGTIAIDARAQGPVAAPRGSATARLDALELRPSSRAWPALRMSGVLEATHHGASTRGLRVETVGPSTVTGAVTIGAPAAPATVEVDPARPFHVERVDVPITGRGLRVRDEKAQLSIDALDLSLRIAGDPSRSLVLSGDVGIAGARLDPFGGPKRRATGPARPWFEGLPPWLTLDLTLHGPDDALVVNVPVLPDVDFGFRCHVQGNARGGSISGRLHGRGLYSRLALSLFGPKGASECRVLKE